MKKAGFELDPLTAGKEFISCSQSHEEKVEHFAMRLKKLFKQAYEKEDPASDVLLQRFLTGLRPSISRQLLINGKPKTIEEAIKTATQIEYGLNFDSNESAHCKSFEEKFLYEAGCHTVQQGPTKLEKAVEELTQRISELETSLRSKQEPRPTRYARWSRGRGRPVTQNRKCWRCGEEGHLQRSCPLNYQGPAQWVTGWPNQ